MNATKMIAKLGAGWTFVSGRVDRVERTNPNGTRTQITACPKGFVVGTVDAAGNVLFASHHFTFIRTLQVVR